MFETLALLASAYLLTWQALVAILLIGIIFEHRGARGWAVFTGLAAMGISYFVFDVSLKVIGIATALYLIVGVVWSFWRYNVHVKDSVKWIKTLQPSKFSETYIQTQIDNLAPTKNLNMITAWIIIWPFSAVENLLGDIINAIQALVTKVFKGVYHKIYLSHVKSLTMTTLEE